VVNETPPFELLHPLLRHHIVNSLGWTTLRPLQERSISAILNRSHSLLIAPTAGGKTEAAIFPLLSQLLSFESTGFTILYICPLRALLNNLFERVDAYCSMVGLRAGLWHGDVSPYQRRKLLEHPPHILLTTPESLESMLISQKDVARKRLQNVQTVVVDEIHAFARDDRGTHMLAVLERIQVLAGKPVHRIALSATVGNPDELLAWFVNGSPGHLQVVQTTGDNPQIDVQLDFVGNLENAATVISRLHRGEKRLVFCDSRRRVEELGVLLRALGVETFLSHSSLSREQRNEAEKAFAESRDCVIVATSTMELGIDVGDLDRVVQIDSPSTVASFLQRLGRTGRRTGSTRNCLFLATTLRAFLQGSGLLRLWQEGYVEPILAPHFPAHLAAQQLIAMVLQEGRIAKNTCMERLNRVAAFAEIGPVNLKIILDHLILNTFFFEDAGFLTIGDSSQREFGHKNFLELVSAFTSPPIFTVLHGVRELGSIDQNLLWHLQSLNKKLLRLAGRDWQIVSIEWKSKVVYVTLSTEKGRPLWLGEGESLSFEICQSIRKCLMDDDLPPWLCIRGQEALAQARKDYEILRNSTSSCMITDRGLEWHTFAGGHLNDVISITLSSLMHSETQSNDFEIVILRETEATYEVLSEILAPLSKDDLLSCMQADPQWLRNLKFSECLPHQIAQRVFVKRLNIDKWEIFKSVLKPSLKQRNLLHQSQQSGSP
jgi:ATP-dependent Lhr-like helicase